MQITMSMTEPDDCPTCKDGGEEASANLLSSSIALVSAQRAAGMNDLDILRFVITAEPEMPAMWLLSLIEVMEIGI